MKVQPKAFEDTEKNSRSQVFQKMTLLKTFERVLGEHPWWSTLLTKGASFRQFTFSMFGLFSTL